MTDTLPKPDLANPVHLLAFGLGAGCVPKAPGTFGTRGGSSRSGTCKSTLVAFPVVMTALTVPRDAGCG